MKTSVAANGAALARFVASTGQRIYPADVVDAAKMCLVDWFGVVLGGQDEPVAAAVRGLARKWAVPGNSRLIWGGTTSAQVAALVNGATAHCLDFDDTHATSLAHLGGPTWAAVLALAGEMGAGASGSQALAAFITGFEVGGKIGGAGLGVGVNDRGFHSTGVMGRLSATAAACALLGLDEDRVAHAMGLAATQSGGLTASFGTMAKPFHAGKAAMDALLSADLSAQGFEAATGLLDGAQGLASALVQDGSVTIGPLEFSEGRELMRNAFKPYACCMLTHTAVDAGRKLAGELNGAEIQEVRVSVDALAVKLAGIPHPSTPLEGKFSLAYCVALALSGYKAVNTDFTPERLAEPALQALTERVRLQTVPVANQEQHLRAVLEVDLSDGRHLSAEVLHPLGNPANPLGWGDLEAKFMGLVRPLLGENSRGLLESLRHFEQPGAMSQALRLVARD